VRFLLDTHALLWFLQGSENLPPVVRTVLQDDAHEVFVSAVSAMEVTTKFRLGKLPSAAVLANRFEETVAEKGFLPLPISLEHAERAGSLPIPHKDPFDRLLIAQGQIEAMTLISNEAVFDGFGVGRFW
jgi:PIN domain nuclease of toxin-antitoxin system